MSVTIVPYQACLPAALLALEDVNRNSEILADYHLNLMHKDDKVTNPLRECQRMTPSLPAV